MEFEENEISKVEEPKPSSLIERLSNVIVSPGEVFQGVKGLPVDSLNWVVPMVLSIMAGIFFSLMVFTQVGMVEKVRQIQETALEKQVEAGKMTRAKAEDAQDFMEKVVTKNVLVLGGVVSSIFFTPIVWLFLAFFFHWLARIASRSHIPFTKCFEVIGLCSMVAIPGVLVNMLLVIITENPSMTFSLALAFQEYDPTEKMHALAAEVDIMRIWYISVLAVAWSRLTQHPLASCGAWLFGIWIAFRVGIIMLGS